MKRKLLLVILSLVAVASFALNIVVTINPYYLILMELVAGTDSQLSLLVKPNVNPHTFSPTISDVRKLSTADLIVANGLGLDAYLKDYKNVVYVSDFIPQELFLKGEQDHEHEEDETEEFNPHIWISPLLVRDYIIPGIVNKLSEKDPKNKEIYEKNAVKLRNSLIVVIDRFEEILVKYKGGVLIITHPSIVYLTEPYEIETLALEEGHGKEPSAKKIMEIIAKAKDRKLIGIFAEKQFNARLLEPIAKELKRQIVTIDHLGVDAKGVVDYFESLLKAIEKAIGMENKP